MALNMLNNTDIFIPKPEKRNPMQSKIDFRSNYAHFFRRIAIALPLWTSLLGVAKADIVADHTHTKINNLPISAVDQAKSRLHIAFWHTGYGSQLISGMEGIVGFMNHLGHPRDLYALSKGRGDSALDLRELVISKTSDLAKANREIWSTSARNFLKTHPEINVWCIQLDSKESDPQPYLKLMSQLESEHPSVKFVYMTTHLDGGGEGGIANRRNVRMRNFVRLNNKILYDFADIESYDPDGQVNYMSLFGNANCDFDSDGNGSRESNWAVSWQKNHVENQEWYKCDSVHSQALNANRKAYAAWWLWARLAGWSECAAAPSNLSADVVDDKGLITLNWQNNSPNADEIIIQRRVNGGAWNYNYTSVTAGINTLQDVNLPAGTYSYRVLARAECGDSGYSNEPTACIIPGPLNATKTAPQKVMDFVDSFLIPMTSACAGGLSW